MILSPFSLWIGQSRYELIDRRAIDSTADRGLVKRQIMAELAVQKAGAMCSGIGVPESGDVDNLIFGVYRGPLLLGGIILTTLQSVGRWDDWATGAGVFTARPMPAIPLVGTQEAAAIHAEFGSHLLTKSLNTIAGSRLAFRKLSWAIFKGLTDEQNEKTRAYHHAFADDRARFKVTETPDGRDPKLTRVDAEAR